jgi:hypothetical protein
MRRTISLLILAWPAVALSQGEPVPIQALERGAEIRMWSQEPPLKGWKLQYLGRTDTSVVVAERLGSAPVPGFRNEIPFSRIERFEVNQGKAYDGRRFLRRTLKGGGLGLVAGALLVGAALATDPDNEGNAYAIIILPPAGLAIGALVGGVLGLQRTTIWQPVSLRR